MNHPFFSSTVADDQTMMCDLRTVTYYVRRKATGSGAFADGVTVTHVFRSPLSRSEPMRDGLFGVSSANFTLLASKLGGIVPKEGDRIVDNTDSQGYTVTSLRQQNEGGDYLVTCDKE